MFVRRLLWRKPRLAQTFCPNSPAAPFVSMHNLPEAASCSKFKYLDGSIVEHPDSATALDVAEKIGSRLARRSGSSPPKSAIVSSTQLDHWLGWRINPHSADAVDRARSKALDVLRHSIAHIMARAVMQIS